MVLNFPPEHSHRWADHVDIWLSRLGDHPYKKERISDVCYKRNELYKNYEGGDYSPLLTSLMYGLGMNEKMETEARSLRELFDIDISMDEKITEDTDTMMKLFLSDARKFLKGTPYVLTAEDSVFRNYDDILLEIPRKQELENVFHSKPTNSNNPDDLIRLYILSRLAQEYWTLKGATTSYHLIDKFGHEEFGKTIRENAKNISWRITGKLAKIIKLAKKAGIKDMKGMETDHVITKVSVHAEPFSRESHTFFHNCPIYGSYKMTDKILEQKYNKHAFDEGIDFCDICEEHGKQAVNLLTPVFIKPKGRSGKPLSKGGEYCDFVSTTGLSQIPAGMVRKLHAISKTRK